jgi:hypothetical protein
MDELRRRQVRDVERTDDHPMPRVVNVGELVIVAIVVIATAVLIWFGT